MHCVLTWSSFSGAYQAEPAAPTNADESFSAVLAKLTQGLSQSSSNQTGSSNAATVATVNVSLVMTPWFYVNLLPSTLARQQLDSV